MRLWIVAAILILFPMVGEASKTSFHVPHPIGWMHDLPVGETPGWSGRFWVNLELSQGNIWNDEFDLTDRRNGDIYTYKADYEQTSVITDIGFALGDRWSFGIEAPFAARGGGVMDDFIDQFHIFIGAERFLRNQNQDFGKSYVVETNSQSEVQNTWSAVGNLKFKTKYWLWQWRGSKNGSCDCGLAVSGQVKVPLAEPRSGYTSGSNDYSMLVHLGAPIGKQSGIWATAGFTALGENEVFKKWPRRKWAQMYELSMDFAFTDSWGLILQGRVESPIMHKSDLSFNYSTVDPDDQTIYRVASGWNSLVLWRGSESAGFRWRSRGGTQVNFLIVEDWWIGKQDSKKDGRYVNNAPDVAFVSQLHFGF